MNIAIGCDEAAFDLKETIKELVLSLGHTVEDVGVYDKNPASYPDIAVKAATLVTQGLCVRGILLCGTGIGMAITANKVPGIRAAVCHDSFSTERSRKSNNAQIMTMGARVIGVELAKQLTKLWLECEYEGGRSAPKVDRIMEYEKNFLSGALPCKE